MTYRELIAFLRSERLRLKKKQGNIAQDAGYAQTQISFWERGIRNPRGPELVDWGKAVGYEISFQARMIEDG